MMNMTENAKLVQYRTFFKLGFSSRWMSSKQRVTLDAKINTRMNHSKAGVSTTERTACRIRVHFRPNLVCRHLSQQPHLLTKHNCFGLRFCFFVYVFVFLFMFSFFFCLCFTFRNSVAGSILGAFWIFSVDRNRENFPSHRRTVLWSFFVRPT